MLRARTPRPGSSRRPSWRRRLALAGVLTAGALALAAAPAGAVGFRDFSYPGAVAPTGDKPQSKLWLNDGIWWASLFNSVTARHEIYRLDWAAQSWSTTGVPIDARRTSTADTLWDGTHLYVASAGPNPGNATQSARVYRFTYDPAAQTYALDDGFPVTVSAGGMEAVVLAKDSTGMLWVTFTQNNQVLTAHSTVDQLHWSQPAVLPLPQATALAPDDIASIVAYDGKIGVMWSDQGDQLVEAFEFAIHVDGAPDSAWTLSTASSGDHLADDHINLKSLSGDAAGRVFAATKTSQLLPGQTLQQLLVLEPNGTWTQHPFGTVADNQTRSQVLIDTEHRQLYMFVSDPCCSGGDVFYKQTSLDNIAFPPGPGTPLIQLASDPKINNPTSTKQSLSSSTGLVVLGGDDTTLFYAHGALPLGPDERTPDTRIASGPSGGASVTTATFLFTSDEATVRFECRLDGSAFSSCGSPLTFNGLAPGAHSFAVRAIDSAGNADATPATAAWTVPAPPAAPAPVPRASAPGAVARLAGVRLTALSRQRLGRTGRVRVAVRCRTACRAVINVRVRGVGRLKAVRRLRANRRRVVVLRMTRTQLRAARRRLARGRRILATVTVTATDAAGRRLPAARRVVRLVR